jgi:catechol 2,3-dioxygenase-like lactoylglutathione lyase family enzyme
VETPRLFRVILPVADIEAAAAFYGRMLGVPGRRVSQGRHYFDCGGTILACYEPLADGDPARVGPNPQYLYFSAEDLDEAYSRARAGGCRDLGEIEVQPWARAQLLRALSLREPDLLCRFADTFHRQPRLAVRHFMRERYLDFNSAPPVTVPRS